MTTLSDSNCHKGSGHEFCRTREIDIGRATPLLTSCPLPPAPTHTRTSSDRTRPQRPPCKKVDQPCPSPVDAAESECAHEGVCHDLEGQGTEGGIIRGGAGHGLLSISHLQHGRTKGVEHQQEQLIQGPRRRTGKLLVTSWLLLLLPLWQPLPADTPIHHPSLSPQPYICCHFCQLALLLLPLLPPPALLPHTCAPPHPKKTSALSRGLGR